MFCNFLIILWANASKYGSLRYGKVLYILYAPTPARSTMEVTGQMLDTIFTSFDTSPLYLYVLSDHPCLLLLSLPPVLSA